VVEFEKQNRSTPFPLVSMPSPKKKKKEPTNLRVKKMGQNSNFPN
jgi:hypothetical protein